MICCYEMRKGRGSCVEPSSLKNFGSMFDAEAIHAQIPSNIEPKYQWTWCNGHKTGHASFLSSYIAILPLVSPMFVLGLIAGNVRSSLLEMAPPVVCRRIQHREPIEIGEALGAQWFIAPVLLTARAHRKCRHFLGRKPLPLMCGNEPHRPGSGCEPCLKRPDFWLADPVGRRGAYG